MVLREEWAIVGVKGGWVIGFREKEFLGRDGMWVRDHRNATPFPTEAEAQARIEIERNGR